jgi:hypothetical protein
MWSGPRNISTAMMRSWGARPDTIVCDEPLYAHYLKVTGLPHPGAAETLAAYETDWRKVVPWLTGPLPDGKAVFYQKHMAHHMLANIELDWVHGLTNCFLIREPREMIASLREFIPKPRIEDTGLPQQVRIFEMVGAATGRVPPVLDARDILLNPRAVLEKFCDRIGLPFYDEMLEWPAGRRETDGTWAKHWYAKVERTTTFGTYRRKIDAIPDELEGLLADCQDLYHQLHPHRITAV